MHDDQNKKNLDDLDLNIDGNNIIMGEFSDNFGNGNNQNESQNRDDLEIISPQVNELSFKEKRQETERIFQEQIDGKIAEKDQNKSEKIQNEKLPAKKEEVKEENVILPKTKIALIKKLISNIKENNEQLSRLLAPFFENEDEARVAIGQMADDSFSSGEKALKTEEKIIEGVFDGEKMIGPDGKQYSVPANYASKSKLVEGDMMKLTITGNGTFLYKQIGPVERGRIIGMLEKDAAGAYYVAKDDKRYRILTASVTYFRGEAGDEAIILVPKYGVSSWAAVENIIKPEARTLFAQAG
ncbi:MAG: hypothetical protein WC715_05680 [Patescibacteria group bacterium]|jgi:hypothetical protein